MILVERREANQVPSGAPSHAPAILEWLTSTDHKMIGKSYLVTSCVFFLAAGVMALLIRIQLAAPDNTFVSQHTYNELFTMHGSLMMYLFAGPFAFGGLANYLVPIQIGAPDMAFPRLNALSYWLYLTGGLTIVSGFFVAGGAADFGWVAYAPLSDAVNSPGAGPDLWIVGLILTGFSAIFTGVNLVTTIFYLRAPGLTMFRMPIFCWDMLVTAILILIAFPVLTAALVMLWCDRHIGSHIYTVSGGGVPVLWQNLFWFFGHPEVYILVLPFFGIVTEVIAVFSRKPVFGYPGMVFATIGIGALSTAVWAHHMFTTGTVLLPFFALMSFLIAVPTGIKFFNWIGTMWRGSVRYQTPMLFSVGFLIVFLFGGVTGVLLASPPLDFAFHDTYFVVAHFHQVLAASAEFGGLSAVYYWHPKITGRMLREDLGKVSFWFLLVGFLVAFMPQYLLGLHGMPRRIATYSAATGWQGLNDVSTAGAFLIFIAIAASVVNVYVSWRRPVLAPANPWDGHTLEWATTSPPPAHNFHSLPPIRSERPVWDFNHPEAADARTGHDSRTSEEHGTSEIQYTVVSGTAAEEVLHEPVGEGDHGPDLVGLLASEHERIVLLASGLISAHNPIVRRRNFGVFAKAVAQHEFAETLVVRPLLEGAVRDAIDHDERELEFQLLRLTRRMLWRPGGHRTTEAVDAIPPALATHFGSEAHLVVPVIERLDDELRRSIRGTWLAFASSYGPTRPHPRLPRRVGEVIVLGAMVAVSDRIRDRVRRLVFRW